MRALFLRATLPALLLPSVAGAQTVTLSEAQALARMSTDSPRVRVIRAAVDLARVDVLAAKRWPNPQFTFDRESVVGVTENITTVTQPLPITGRRGLEESAAVELVMAGDARANDQVRRLRADLRLAFADLWAAQVRERELTRGRDRLRELADILANREKVGDAAGFDRLRADREALDVDADVTTAEIDRLRAQAALVSFFPQSTGSTVVVAVREGSRRASIPSIDELMAKAESTRGELLAFRHDIEAARFAERAGERRAVPELAVAAGTKSSTALGGGVGSVITVYATLPLFDRGGPERAAALARSAQAQARMDGFRLALRAQIEMLRAAVFERRATADRYRAGAGSLVDQVEHIAQISYEAGERGILDLLDAYQSASNARLRQAALDAAVWQAEIELEFASGWEIPS